MALKTRTKLTGKAAGDAPGTEADKQVPGAEALIPADDTCLHQVFVKEAEYPLETLRGGVAGVGMKEIVAQIKLGRPFPGDLIDFFI